MAVFMRTFWSGLLVALFLLGCSKDANQLLQNAKEYQAKKDADAAIITLKQAVQQEPGNGAVRFYLGSMYNEIFDGVSAEKELKHARELGVVDGGRLSLELARAYRLQNKYRELLAEIVPSIAYEPAVQATIVAWRGSSYFALGQLNDAKQSWNEATRVGSNVPAVAILEMQIKVAERDMAAATKVVEETVQNHPQSFDAWSAKADIARVQGNIDEQLVAYQKMLEIYPRHLDALVGRSSIYINQGKLEAAQRDVDLLLNRYKNHAPTYQQLALLQIARQQFRQAQETSQLLLKAQPDSAAGLLLSGMTHLALGSPAQAEIALSRFLASNPQHPTARRLLATALLQLNQSQKVLETIEPLLRAEVKDAAIYEIAGDAHARLGEYAKASAWLDKAQAMDSKRSGVLLTKQASYDLNAGKTDVAIDHLEKAIAASSGPNRADALLILTHLGRKDFTKAMEAANALEKKAPTSPEAAQLKATVLLADKKEAEARTQFEKALALRPTYFPAAASLANLDRAAGDEEAARKRFEGVLAADPNHLQAMIAIAEAHKNAGNIPAAIKMLERAAATHKQALAPRVQLVELLYQTGEKQRAAAVAEEALVANPDHPVALELMGGVQVLNGDTNRAISTFGRLTSLYPKSSSGYFSLAQAYGRNGSLREAEQQIRKALSLNPNEARFQRYLIDVLLGMRRVEDALKFARTIRANEPKSPKGLVFEAEIYASQGNHRSAVAAYEKALEIAPMGDIAFKLYMERARNGDADAALKGLEQWVDKHPENRFARIALADLLSAKESYRAALTHYEKLAAHYPNDPLALNGIAWNRFNLKDGSARASAERAYKLAPGNPIVQDTLGWILFSQGDVARARELLELAARNSKAPDVHYHYGAVLAKSGDVAGARRELAVALSSSTGFPGKKAAAELLNSLEQGKK